MPTSSTTTFTSHHNGQTFQGLPGIFADCLPDTFGEKIIERFFLQKHALPARDVHALMKLAYLHDRSIGALEFYPALEQKDYLPCLIKFDGVMDGEEAYHYGKLEYVYHKMARDAGLKVTNSYLIDTGNAAHFVTERFDRDHDKNRPYHTATLCGLTNSDFRQKNSCSYEVFLRITRGLNPIDFRDVEEAFRRAVFNVIFKNEDYHTKNISFLMNQKGSWCLAPAYDLNYVRVKNGHQMSLNGKNQKIIIDDLFMLASKNDIKKIKQKK